MRLDWPPPTGGPVQNNHSWVAAMGGGWVGDKKCIAGRNISLKRISFMIWEGKGACCVVVVVNQSPPSQYRRRASPPHTHALLDGRPFREGIYPPAAAAERGLLQ